ncbi:cupin domain-containing protein [uncultured Clostridium sp.]|uniref:cupin domain-containing protein n=1 Tax=uncultured Clostridium sp. TaxID=59620 RepID=UPI0025E595A8|nr:cupin domain-containing protein [uncultured Clostridium sp.]
MKFLRNIKPYEPIKLGDMITHSGKKIASKSLINNDKHEIRFFSFAKGEDIDKEFYEMESIFIVIEGKIKISYKETDEVIANEGDILALESGVPYGVEALTDAKILNILISDI